MPELRGRAGAHALWASLQAEHDRYREAVSYIPTKQLRLQEDLRRYLCMRCAGFLEQVTFTILDEYLLQKSSPPVLDFARSYFSRAPNLRYKPFVELVGRFGDGHRRDFERFLSGANQEALTDLLEVRNDIAHGKYHGGQKLDPERYVRLCETIYDWLVSHFLGSSMEVIGDDGYTRLGTETARPEPSGVSDGG